MTRQEIDERRNALNTEVMNLESSLRAADYKGIKCLEALITFLETKYTKLREAMPYDVDALIAERQQMRDRINEAQAELEQLDSTEPDPEE